MSLPLDFHPVVRDEIDDAHAWYEQRRPGLGGHFLDEVQRVLAEIAANPARYGFADTDIREGSLTRFPYAVYYRVLAESYPRTRSLPHVPRPVGMAVTLLIERVSAEPNAAPEWGRHTGSPRHQGFAGYPAGDLGCSAKRGSCSTLLSTSFDSGINIT